METFHNHYETASLNLRILFYYFCYDKIICTEIKYILCLIDTVVNGKIKTFVFLAYSFVLMRDLYTLCVIKSNKNYSYAPHRCVLLHERQYECVCEFDRTWKCVCHTDVAIWKSKLFWYFIKHCLCDIFTNTYLLQ